MSSLEWELYRRLYVELLHSPAARPPRLLVYLHAPLDTIVARIRLAGPAQGAGDRGELLGGAARAVRALDRRLPGLPRAEPRRARLRPRRRPDGHRADRRTGAGAIWSRQLPQTDLFPGALVPSA